MTDLEADREAELHLLKKRLLQAENLAESYRNSALIHGRRLEGLGQESADLRELLDAWHGSRGARLVKLLRAVWLLGRGRLPSGRKLGDAVSKLKEIQGSEGLQGISFRLRRRLHMRRQQRLSLLQRDVMRTASGSSTHAQLSSPISAACLKQLTPHVLLIAELSLQQCAKYRVWQKCEQLENLGWKVSVVDWRHQSDCLTALQVSTEVIFYRVPAFPNVHMLLSEARRLGLQPRWEVDDLIFEESLYRENGNLETLRLDERNQLLSGVRLFREALLTCGVGIASTETLADAMLQAGAGAVAVIHNALDAETLKIAESLRERPRRSDGNIMIVYGSGTKTHDKDFLEAAEGVLAAMEQNPHIHLRIVGELTLPSSFSKVAGQVEYLSGRDYAGFLALLAEADLSIAPLEPTIFNDAKSNIKFLEAAALGIPCICSPRREFRAAITQGVSGFLAESASDWREYILRLAQDSTLRVKMGHAARSVALEKYGSDTIQTTEVAALFPAPESRKRADFSVLVANVYFAPRSFGGATLIAEEMARRLAEDGTEVSVFTSRPADMSGRGRSALRYDSDGLPVLSCVVPPDHDRVAALDMPENTAQFDKWLDAMQPDIVHIHALQGLGIGILRICMERGVPYALTLHDAWFLCERQFMVRADGRYCFQRKIDLKTCQACVPEAQHLTERAVLMRQALDGASILITPSETHRQLYIENGVQAHRIVVNRNGFFWPSSPRPARPANMPLRFGYVGGTEDVKGYSILRQAFESLDRGDWSLTLVDNKLNLGFASIVTSGWKMQGRVSVVPAYNRETMDAFFAGIDVLVFPSQWMESYGLTVREALARDVWVIATAPGGQAEDITEGVNGNLVSLNTTLSDLRMVLGQLLDQPERFGNYKNPLKDHLPDFETQADELKGILKRAVDHYRQEQSLVKI